MLLFRLRRARAADVAALINGDHIGERYPRVEYEEKTRAHGCSASLAAADKNYVIAKRQWHNNDTWVDDNIPFQRTVDRPWMAGRVHAGQGGVSV